MTTHLRRAAAAVLCAGAALALTSCSSFGGSTSTAGSAASAASAGSGASASAAADPTAGLPNGTKLATYLLPNSVVPSLKLDTKAYASSGDTFAEPSDKPVAKAQACQLLGATTWETAGGVGPSAAAGNDFVDSYGNEYYQELDAFEGVRATRDFAALKNVFTECATYKSTNNGTPITVHVKLKTLAGVGDEAVEAVVTSPDYQGGETLVVIRTGKVVVTTMYNDQKTTGEKAVTLARQLLKRVPATSS